VTETQQLLAALSVNNTLDAEAAMQLIIQRSALQPNLLIEFLTQHPVPHFEFQDAARTLIQASQAAQTQTLQDN
jgi:hypothetical protein